MAELVAEGEATSCKSSLASLPDVTSNFLTRPWQKARIRIPKSTVMTFQTWAMRNSALHGLILGRANKGKNWSAVRVVVADSIERIWDNEKVKVLCGDMDMQFIGLVTHGHVDEQKRELAKTWGLRFLTADLKTSLFICVS